MQEAALDKVKQEVTKNKELLDSDAVLPQEDELCTKLARVADSLTAKDNLIQVSAGFYRFISHNLHELQ